VAARLVHRYSGRHLKPFMAMNCAGVPDSLLESELFGHVRGSFTGAYRDKPGLLEQANGGTIFMDEVGEMSLRMQALLLRFLENGEIHRVGADRRSATVNVRVIAATNRVLHDRIAENAFREDLYYRLNVIHVVIPPLRERREDIEPLMRYFIELYCNHYRVPAPEISGDALKALVEYAWPGNVRELKNVVERFIVRGERGGPILVQHLPRPITPSVLAPRVEPRPQPGPVSPVPGPATARVSAGELFDRIVSQRESFWSAVYEPFMARDLTRADVRHVISAGLQHTRGNYKMLIEFFNMAPTDYKRFLNFLRKHQCHMPFQQFRTTETLRPESEPSDKLALA
jgi:DNA-binding NtrC family response regulator